MRAIIIGAGIGGLTTAIALKQQGIEYDVYEAAPELKEIGAGIWVPTNAMNVFERLQIAAKVRDNGKLMEKISVGNAQGRIFQTVTAAEVIPIFGNGTTTIHRGKLQALLRDELDPALVHTRKRFVRFEETSSQVTAYFEDGTSVTGDVLLGADGLRSAVRRQLFGEMPLRYSGQTCWRAATHFRLPEHLSTEMRELWGKGNGLRFAYSQMTDEQVYFYCTVASAAGGKDVPGELKRTLQEQYAMFGPLAHEIIESAEESQIIRTDLYDLKPMPEWVKGKVALLGDAAHATTPNLGQGGAQAVEDGYVLGLCLTQSSDVEHALRQYQSVRYDKAVEIVNRSWQYGKISNLKSPWIVALRDWLMPRLPKALSQRQLKRLYELSY